MAQQLQDLGRKAVGSDGGSPSSAADAADSAASVRPRCARAACRSLLLTQGTQEYCSVFCERNDCEARDMFLSDGWVLGTGAHPAARTWFGRVRRGRCVCVVHAWLCLRPLPGDGPPAELLTRVVSQALMECCGARCVPAGRHQLLAVARTPDGPALRAPGDEEPMRTLCARVSPAHEGARALRVVLQLGHDGCGLLVQLKDAGRQHTGAGAAEAEEYAVSEELVLTCLRQAMRRAGALRGDCAHARLQCGDGARVRTCHSCADAHRADGTHPFESVRTELGVGGGGGAPNEVLISIELRCAAPERRPRLLLVVLVIKAALLPDLPRARLTTW